MPPPPFTESTSFNWRGFVASPSQNRHLNMDSFIACTDCLGIGAREPNETLSFLLVATWDWISLEEAKSLIECLDATRNAKLRRGEIELTMTSWIECPQREWGGFMPSGLSQVGSILTPLFQRERDMSSYALTSLYAMHMEASRACLEKTWNLVTGKRGGYRECFQRQLWNIQHYTGLICTHGDTWDGSPHLGTEGEQRELCWGGYPLTFTQNLVVWLECSNAKECFELRADETLKGSGCPPQHSVAHCRDVTKRNRTGEDIYDVSCICKLLCSLQLWRLPSHAPAHWSELKRDR